MKAVVAAFNQEKALVGAFSVITNLRMELFEALKPSHNWQQAVRVFTHCKLSTVHCCEELRQLWLINTDTTLSPSPAPACESCHGTSHLILGTFYSFYLNKWMLPQVCSSTGAGQGGGVCGQAAGHGILRPAPRTPVLSSSPLKLARPSPDFSMMF